ncbi:hypothetical protein PInf_025090 [Phytophthora infestans]|nr:hypothetical protein PInf_025090 [Phytophthora infestans]
MTHSQKELQKLMDQIESAQRRKQQQLAELLGSTNGNEVAFPAHPEHQAASHRFTLLATKYKVLDREYQILKQQLADAKQSLSAYSDLEKRHDKLTLYNLL